ncbi:hypothetical protein [Micromonospora sp. NPDC005806]
MSTTLNVIVARGRSREAAAEFMLDQLARLATALAPLRVAV